MEPCFLRDEELNLYYVVFEIVMTGKNVVHVKRRCAATPDVNFCACFCPRFIFISNFQSWNGKGKNSLFLQIFLWCGLTKDWLDLVIPYKSKLAFKCIRWTFLCIFHEEETWRPVSDQYHWLLWSIWQFPDEKMGILGGRNKNHGISVFKW